MTFTEALAAVFNNGDRVTRTAWNNRNIFIALDEHQLRIKGVDADGQYHPLIVTEQDFFASDWEVIVDA